MKSGDKVTIGSTTFIVLKMVKCIIGSNHPNDGYDYVRVDEEYPVILENDLYGEYIEYLVVTRKGTKQYYKSDRFIEIQESNMEEGDLHGRMVHGSI